MCCGAVVRLGRLEVPLGVEGTARAPERAMQRRRVAVGYGVPHRPPDSIPKSPESARAEEALRRDRIAREMRGGNVFVELWLMVKVVVTLPWRVVRWIGSKVAREERADRS